MDSNPFSSINLELTSIKSLLKNLLEQLSLPTPDSSRFPIGIDRVCELTGLAKPTIYGLVSAQKIPHAKPGGKKLYFFEEEIIDWIRQGKRKTLSEIEADAEAHIENQRIKKA